jgi:tripartite ATP-independent transporter DctM subunit
MLSVLMTVSFIVLMALRMPVSIAIGLSTLPPLFLLDRNPILIPQFMMQGVHSVSLLAVPFFLLAGNLFTTMGLSRRIWDFARALVGHLKGGLGHVMVIANLIFAGISGSALVDAAALGVIGIPEMVRSGYSRRFAAAITLCSSVVGPIIPPSINFVIYGVIAQVSIGRLFLAGVVPGVVIGLCMMAAIYLMTSYGRERVPPLPRAGARDIGRSFLVSLPTTIVPVVIVLGMGFGLFTPTEVGIFAAAYALVLGAVYREASLRDIWDCFAESAKSTIKIMFIIAVSTVAGWIYAYDGTSQQIATWLFTVTHDKTVLLLIINLFLLVLGCLLEPIPLMILTAPIVLPVVQAIGIDLVHFGVIMGFNITIGIITPPMGIGLYVMTGVSKVGLEELIRACMPLLLPLIVALLIITYVPALSLWLPNLVMGP